MERKIGTILSKVFFFKNQKRKIVGCFSNFRWKIWTKVHAVERSSRAINFRCIWGEGRVRYWKYRRGNCQGQAKKTRGKKRIRRPTLIRERITKQKKRKWGKSPRPPRGFHKQRAGREGGGGKKGCRTNSFQRGDTFAVMLGM